MTVQDVLDTISGWLPIVAFFLPLAIGLLTKSSLSERGKAVVMLVFTGIAALIAQVEASNGILTDEMAITWLGTMVTTIASYYGVWKPLGAGNPLPDKGIGPSEAVYD